jgi:hypothetical protein
LSSAADPKADIARRDEMALAALPYFHQRTNKVRKKELRERESDDAGKGTATFY